MVVESALFDAGRMHEKNRFFLQEARKAHDRLTNLYILTNPLLCGVWQFRQLTEDFVHLNENVTLLKDALLDHISFPSNDSAIRRMDLDESVTKISWDRQKNSLGEMMFLVSCAIYEGFLEELENKIRLEKKIKIPTGDIKKGFQFPKEQYDLTQNPPLTSKSKYGKTTDNALSHFKFSNFMISHLCPMFPIRNKRDIFIDFEQKTHTYLLFKKIRNCLIHGGDDKELDHQYDIVSKVVTKESQGIKLKLCVIKDRNKYMINHFISIGFIGLLMAMLREIDLIYSLSEFGEDDLLTALRSTAESKRTGGGDKRKELMRLKLTLNQVGQPKFLVDEAARVYFIRNFSWRG